MIDYDSNPDIVELPPSNTLFPRFRKTPSKPIKTKWEAFADSRGIKKKRKEKLVFDKASNQWLPAYGKGSIRDLNKERNIIKDHTPG